MCGRFPQKSPARKTSKQFKVEEVPPLAERGVDDRVLDVGVAEPVREEPEVGV